MWTDCITPSQMHVPLHSSFKNTFHGTTAQSGAKHGGEGALIHAKAIWEMFWSEVNSMAAVTQRQMTARVYLSSEI